MKKENIGALWWWIATAINFIAAYIQWSLAAGFLSLGVMISIFVLVKTIFEGLSKLKASE